MIALVLATGLAMSASGASQEQVVSPVQPTVRIGDDICAVQLDVRCDVFDSRGRRVAGAELSGLHQSRTAEGDWHLVGLTGASGRVQGWFCLQSSSAYVASPPIGQVTLAFRVAKAGYTPLELQHVVKAQKLLQDGLLVVPGVSTVVPKVEAIKRKAAYKVRLRAELRD